MYRGICLLILILGIHCSNNGGADPDLGVADLGMAPDDLSMPPDSSLGKTTLSLVAGGLGGPGTADGTGSLARFNSINSVALDGNGNAYMADYFNYTIRKVVLASGVVTTVAGMPGISGSTDGTGPAARFSLPCGVAVDSSGNLYVADYGNYTIRKVVLASGDVTTVAGMAGMAGSVDGTGPAARFSSPVGLAIGQGNLYIADFNNHTIRQMVLLTGVVTTVAGVAGTPGSTDGATGAMTLFNQPEAVATDGSGTLYVADTTNDTIRKVVAASGATTTLAGTAGMLGSVDGTGPAARFAHPAGLTVDSSGNVYVADTSNYTIRKVTSAGVTTTLAGAPNVSGSVDGTGAAARFNNAQAIAVDSTGNLYVADSLNNTLRKVTSGGVTTTLAGTVQMRASTDGTGSAARFNQPVGVAIDANGSLYIADFTNNTIRKVVPSSGVTTTLAGLSGTPGSTDGIGSAARFRQPRGVATDGNGNLYVADTLNDTIRKVVLASGMTTTLAGAALMGGITDGTGAAARFNQPSGVAADSNGNLFIADTLNNTIRKVVIASGVTTTLAGTAQVSGSIDGTGSAARFNQPFGVAVDGNGNLYVADGGNQTIRKVVIASGVTTTLAGTAGIRGSADGVGTVARFSNPRGVALDGNDNLYIADTLNCSIRRIFLPTMAVTTPVGLPGRCGVQPGSLPAALNHPVCVAAMPGGSLYLTDLVENAVLEVR